MKIVQALMAYDIYNKVKYYANTPNQNIISGVHIIDSCASYVYVSMLKQLPQTVIAEVFGYMLRGYNYTITVQDNGAWLEIKPTIQ